MRRGVVSSWVALRRGTRLAPGGVSGTLPLGSTSLGEGSSGGENGGEAVGHGGTEPWRYADVASAAPGACKAVGSSGASSSSTSSKAKGSPWLSTSSSIAEHVAESSQRTAATRSEASCALHKLAARATSISMLGMAGLSQLRTTAAAQPTAPLKPPAENSGLVGLGTSRLGDGRRSSTPAPRPAVGPAVD